MKQSNFITWAELRVGILVVASLGLAILGTLTLGGRLGLFQRSYTLYTLMPTASGLEQGAPVRLAGVNVGAVSQVEFITAGQRDSLGGRLERAYGDSLGDRAIIVQFSVRRSVRDKLTRSSRAKIGTVGLLGDKYLDLEVGSSREAQLEEGALVLNARPIDYEGLISRAAEGVEELVGSLAGSRQMIERVNAGEGTLGRLINDPELYDEWLRLSSQGTDLLNTMQHGEGALPSLLNDPLLYDKLVATTDDLEGLTMEIREGDGSLSRLIRDPDLYNELVETIREGKALIGDVKDGEGTVGKFVNDPELYERLNKFVVEAQGLLNDIRENPRKYINLKVF